MFILIAMFSTNLRRASWNVNSLNNPVKRSRIMAWIKRAKIQIMLLHETHLSQAVYEKLKKFGFNNTFHSSFRTGHKRGAARLVHTSIHFEYIRQKIMRVDMYLCNVK